MAGMSEAASTYRVRRATVDDLQSLTALWEAMHFPAAELEPRLTEFQVVEAPDGKLLGALALEISGRHGLLHREAFSDFALADALRHSLWERMQSVAKNHGLVRIWTKETAPFWCHSGLHAASPEELKKLPEVWTALPGDWLTIQFRDEEAVEASLDKEFVKFREAAKEQTEQALQRAKILKYGATFMAIILAAVVCAISIYMLKNRGNIPPPP